MAEENKPDKDSGEWQRKVAAKEKRKLKARKEGDRSPWFGLGMFGLVGWSVAIPAVAGTAVGVWLDSKIESGRSFTLMGLGAGLAVGCAMAWYWVQRESKRGE